MGVVEGMRPNPSCEENMSERSGFGVEAVTFRL